MPKVTFKFDKEKDLENHWHKSNWKPNFGEFKINPKVKEICEGKKFEECKKELTNNFRMLYKSKIININLEAVEKAWREIETEFFKRMDNIMKKKFNRNITGYLTTLGICPYDPDEPSFMFSLFYPLPNSLSTCGHEIMHLYFHEFYWTGVEKEIGERKTGDLKEALTVILNLEFKDLWFAEDKGYDEHKELRKFISDEWKKEKDFEKLLEKCVKYLKN
jgi:hypothetical protein